MSQLIFERYEEIKLALKSQVDNVLISNMFADLYKICFNFLKDCPKIDLESQIPGKTYFAFSKGSKFTRPINKMLFTTDPSKQIRFFDKANENNITDIGPDEITKACYNIAICFCAAIDILKEGDQKTPGTFFEYLMGHLFTLNIGVSPRNQVDVLNMDMRSKLPTDFIFDLGQNMPKFHVPVKTSTRERVIQVWAHQRVLDGVYGTGRFICLLTCLGETKLDHKTKQVTEICLPDQWRLYQMFIAQIKRVYYLDVPVKYYELNNFFPKIHVKQFGDFFHEREILLE
jgi:hypothetical protein